MASGAATSSYSARLLLPDLLERGRANELSCPVWQNNALVEPTEAGSTVTIFRSGSTKVVDAQAVTVTDKVATYSYTPAATLDFEEDWRVEWSLVISGETHVFENEAALVRRVLYNVVTDRDLFDRHRALDPDHRSPLSTLTTYQGFRDAAWIGTQQRLIDEGNRPNLILTPSALRKYVTADTLYRVFDDFSTSLNERFASKAEDYRREAEREWGRLRFKYATGDDEENGPAEGRRAARPTIWLTSRA